MWDVRTWLPRQEDLRTLQGAANCIPRAIIRLPCGLTTSAFHARSFLAAKDLRTAVTRGPAAARDTPLTPV